MFGIFGKKQKDIILPILVDIHSHLLPGLDDGVKSIEETIYILKALHKLGYKKVITTPHVMSDYYPNGTADILGKLAQVKEKLIERKIKIQLEAAAEYYLDENLIAKLNNQEKLLTFGRNYLLFETSFFNKPTFLEEAVFIMNAQGYQPVLAHPERYVYLQNDMGQVDKLRNMNLFFQMNMLSLTGFYSRDVKKFAKKLMQADYIDFMGTDCHNAYQVNELINKVNRININLLRSRKLLNRSLL
ncbi:MAG: capsular biosynthesis protein [Cytophagales bacterium]|nr:capsular biosynthesis protein [Cytophagales bacterium]